MQSMKALIAALLVASPVRSLTHRLIPLDFCRILALITSYLSKAVNALPIAQSAIDGRPSGPAAETTQTYGDHTPTSTASIVSSSEILGSSSYSSAVYGTATYVPSPPSYSSDDQGYGSVPTPPSYSSGVPVYGTATYVPSPPSYSSDNQGYASVPSPSSYSSDVPVYGTATYVPSPPSYSSDVPVYGTATSVPSPPSYSSDVPVYGTATYVPSPPSYSSDNQG
ncbi:hypothetical protein HDU67_005458, partial [Dinochytrium kinnereticum]